MTDQDWGARALAEHLVGSVAKGDRILVHGRLEQRQYPSESGEVRTTRDVTAEESV